MQVQSNERQTATSCRRVLRRGRSGRPKIAGAAVLGILAALGMGEPALCQSQPGRFLVSARPDIILECNLAATSCFHVTGASQAAGDPGGGDQQGSSASEPSIASNGTIAFTPLYGTDGSCSGVGAQGICQPHIFLMSADGTGVRQITFNPTDPAIAAIFGGDKYAAISPDGSMVAFISNRNPAGYDTAGHPISAYAVYVVNEDGSGLRQVTPFTYDASGNEHGNMYSVAWSPDSKKLAFKGGQYGTFCGTYFGSPIEFLAVGTINVDGSGETYLACDSINAAGGAFAIDWSPDGTLIADARNSISFGEPAIRITDLTGQGRFSAGITTAALGIQQIGYGGEVCPTDGHCIHFSPDSTRIAYENNSPSDNPSFYGISTIKLDGSGRADSAAFGTAYASNLSYGIWWDGGAYPAPALQMRLAPSAIIEVWPGFSQQLTPTLLDGNNNVILNAAQAYHINYVTYHNCGIQIGPYGLAMFSSYTPGWYEGSSISAQNEGVTTSTGVVFKCWTSPPCTYTLSASSENVGANGGPGSVSILSNPGTTGSSCPWGATSSVPWITFSASSLSGAGKGSVSFLVAPNTRAARQGTITIGGAATLTISQGAVGSRVYRRYFAEGAATDFFDCYFAVANPGGTAANVQFQFLRDDGVTVNQAISVGPTSRATVNAKSVPGLAPVGGFSTVVESDMEIAVDRTMSWDATGYGSHAETAVIAPATTWYLAEGATHSGFDLYYLIENPNDIPVDVQITYLRPAPLVPIVLTYPGILPHSRKTIYVNGENPGLAAVDISGIVTSLPPGAPIIVERAMYLNSRGLFFRSGDDSAGVTAPATDWFLAEGATGYFDLFILVANPNTGTAHLTLTYLLPDGTTLSRPLTVAANSRSTVYVNGDAPNGVSMANTPVSTRVHSDLPVLVERTMWWPAGGPNVWEEAHNSPGVTSTATRWALADGEQGGARNTDTYVLIANTSPFTGTIRVTALLEDGSTLPRDLMVPGNSRTTIYMGNSPDPLVSPFGALLLNKRFGTLIESLPGASGTAEIVVERAMYSDSGGIHWAAGTDLVATRLGLPN